MTVPNTPPALSTNEVFADSSIARRMNALSFSVILPPSHWLGACMSTDFCQVILGSAWAS
jgi:hypothetical protein